MQFYFKRKGYIASIILISLLSVATSFIMVPLLESGTNNLVDGNYNLAIYCMLILLGVMAIDYWLGCFTNLIFSRFNNYAIADMSRLLCNKVLDTTSNTYRKLTTGEIVQRVSNDPREFVQKTGDMWYYVIDILNQLAYLTYFYVIDWRIGLIITSVCVLDFVLLKFQMKYRAPKSARATLLMEKQNSQITEFVRGSDDVKSLNIKGSIRQTFDKWTTARRRSNVNFVAYNNIFSTVRVVLQEGLMIACMILVIYFIMIGHLELGVFVLLLRYRSIPTQIGRSLNNFLNNLQDAKISAGRMTQVFDEEKYPQEHFGSTKLDNFTGNIELKDVNFSYDGKKVLDNVSFSLASNHTLGIVGKSGEGKSTILSLINRLNDAQSGAIYFDGIDNKELDELSLRSNVSLVPQSPYIFNTTIKQNLLFANPAATDEQIDEALQKAQLYDFVMSKPDGLDTLVGEGGITLSGGQRQRLAIARAFLTDCKVLMLDEATSALDNENQEDIKRAIAELKSKCSFIIVAHRLSTIVDCDEILVIDDHRVVEQGKHEDLIKTCDVYRELYKLESKNNNA